MNEDEWDEWTAINTKNSTKLKTYLQWQYRDIQRTPEPGLFQDIKIEQRYYINRGCNGF
ncbi:hypothetical protein HCUR_00267 [Holospora curviuscula]|uniref:Uncharacterized protein n=1 Tax=Holospora curviuscula TaxID=1082868 RepID=A0A2S5RE50_9PROT|nr:hypothetical protein HCUR_00267 [Holospora curviuscula]